MNALSALRGLRAAALAFGFVALSAVPARAQTAACTYAVSPTSLDVAASASTGLSASVTTNLSACSWFPSTNVNWILLRTTGGSGSGTLTFDVTANTGSTSRTGTITVTGTSTSPVAVRTISVTQAAAFNMTCTPTGGPTRVGLAYSASCTASGGVTPYSWSISAGALPAGLSLNASGVSATISGTPTTAGSYSYTVRAADGGRLQQSDTVTYSGTIAPASTTLTLSVSPSPSNLGQTVTMTATLSPAGSGTVTFVDGQTTLGSASLANGTATFQTSSLAVGTHPLMALFGGTPGAASSTSQTVVHTVNRASTSTSLSASPTSSSPGQPVTLTAAVSPANATGSVTFLDGSTTIGSATLSNGSATLSTSSLAAGSHSLTAVYGGNNNFNSSTSQAVNVTVGRNATTTGLSASPNPAGIGQTVTMVATVSPASATGSVTFLDGGATLGTASLSNGAATFSTSGLGAGTHTLTASYGGDASNNSSVSSAVSLTVSRASTSTALSVSPTSGAPGQPITLIATVSPASAAGSVTFVDGSTTIATVALVSGTASVTVSNLGPGSHSLSATYGGNSQFSGSTSGVVAVAIGQGTSSTSLSAVPNPASVNQMVTLVALVTPFTATGSVTFRDGSSSLGTINLTTGSATLVTSFLAPGEHTLTAVYSGDANISPSTSNTVVEVIRPLINDTTTSLSVTPNPAPFGQSVILTATVTPSSASGTVTFADGSTPIGIAALSNGIARLTTSTLRVGSHSLQASYSGSGQDGSSQSAAVVVIVNAAPTSTLLSVSPAASSLGQPVTLTASVSPSAATGTVTFRDGGATLGTAALVNGTATFSTSSLSTGNHSLTAAYAGDGNYAASTSSPATASVGLSPTTTTLSVAPLTSVFGQAVTLTATVSPTGASGTVTFRDGSTVLGTSTLNGGVAVLTTSVLAVGSHPLSASYTGDSSNGASTSSSVTATVNRLTSTVVLTASPSPSNPGQQVTLRATVSPSSATGTVTFLDGQATLGSAAIAAGTAVITTSSLSAGSHSLTASYGGDNNTTAATSATVSHNVVSATPLQISLADLAPAFVGTPYSQSLTATGGTPPYTWSLVSNTTQDLSINTSGNNATLSGTPRTAGSFQVTLRVQDAAGVANAGVFTLTVHALPAVTISVTQPGAITDQPVPRLTLAQSYPFLLTGQFTLTFTPNAAGLPQGYNPSRFSTGLATFQVTIPANSTAPSPAIPAVQLGTVAGEIVGTLGPLTVAGTTQTVPFPGQPPTVRITVPRLAPTIVPGSVRIANVTSGGFQVTLDASSTPRDLASGAFVFSATSGTQLNGCTPNCTVQIGSDASAWFSSTAGVSNGGAFSLTFPFTFTGDTSVLGTVSVTLTNSAGTSAAVSGGR